MRKIAEPSDVEIIRSAIRARLADVRTSVPGLVVSYDAATQTCTAKLAVNLPTTNGVPEEVKPLADVPVCWPRGGGYFVTMPLHAGDPLLLVFCEADFSAWRESGEVSDPVQERRHGLYCYAIPGGCDDAHALASAAADHMVVGKDDGPVIRIKDSGIELGAAASDFVALAGLVEDELNKIAASFSSFVPGTGGASFSHPYTTVGSVSASKVKAQ